MAFDCVCAFVDNLPMTEAYCSLHEHVDNDFSAIPPVFPDFEDIATAVYAIDIQQLHLQTLCPNATSMHKPLNPPPPLSSASSGSASVTVTGACPRPTCTNCKALGHSIEVCWEPGGGNVGGREHFLADCLAHSHANLANDALVNYSSSPTPVTPPSTSTTSVTEPTPDLVCSTVSDDVVESNLLELYPILLPESLYTLPPYLTFLQSSDPFALASFSSCFNTIIDSGCTTHIIKDCQCFWTYHPELATLVGTANCGVLNTLAQGEVCFRLLFQGQECVICM